MTLLNTVGSILAIALLILVVAHQVIWGLRRGSSSQALILPLGYAILTPFLIFTRVDVSTASLLFAGSQLIVAYWLFWIYQWGFAHAQKKPAVQPHQ